MILNHMGYIEAFFKYFNFENIKQIATFIKLDSKLKQRIILIKNLKVKCNVKFDIFYGTHKF